MYITSVKVYLMSSNFLFFMVLVNSNNPVLNQVQGSH